MIFLKIQNTSIQLETTMKFNLQKCSSFAFIVHFQETNLSKSKCWQRNNLSQVECDTRSIFKWGLTSLNPVFSDWFPYQI